MQYAALIPCLLVSYLWGSIPWGYLLTGWFKQRDVRDYGSGNIGFTNVLRVAGKPAAILTLILDFGKGWVAVGLLAPHLAEWAGGEHLAMFQVCAFWGVVSGHVFTIFLHFKGGKGIATGAGALLALSPIVLAICLLLWGILVVVFRYISLASIVTAGVLPFLMVLFRRPLLIIAFSFLLSLLVIYRHQGNIRRLRRGTERKIGTKATGNSEVRNWSDRG